MRRLVAAVDHVDRHFPSELAESVGLLPDLVLRHVASAEALERWGYGANWGIWDRSDQP
jgi:hypothetical protein